MERGGEVRLVGRHGLQVRPGAAATGLRQGVTVEARHELESLDGQVDREGQPLLERRRDGRPPGRGEARGRVLAGDLSSAVADPAATPRQLVPEARVPDLDPSLRATRVRLGELGARRRRAPQQEVEDAETTGRRPRISAPRTQVAHLDLRHRLALGAQVELDPKPPHREAEGVLEEAPNGVGGGRPRRRPGAQQHVRREGREHVGVALQGREVQVAAPLGLEDRRGRELETRGQLAHAEAGPLARLAQGAAETLGVAAGRLTSRVAAGAAAPRAGSRLAGHRHEGCYFVRRSGDQRDERSPEARGPAWRAGLPSASCFPDARDGTAIPTS